MSFGDMIQEWRKNCKRPEVSSHKEAPEVEYIWVKFMSVGRTWRTWTFSKDGWTETEARSYWSSQWQQEELVEQCYFQRSFWEESPESINEFKVQHGLIRWRLQRVVIICEEDVGSQHGFFIEDMNYKDIKEESKQERSTVRGGAVWGDNRAEQTQGGLDQ